MTQELKHLCPSCGDRLKTGVQFRKGDSGKATYLCWCYKLKACREIGIKEGATEQEAVDSMKKAFDERP